VETPKPESRKGRWIVIGAIVILVTPIFLIVAVNTFDEELSPEAKALLVAPPNPYRPEENLYLALAGFEGPSGASLVALGEERVAAHEKDIAAALQDPQHRFADLTEQEDRLKFRGEIDFCAPLTESCVDEVERHEAEIARLLRDNRELVQRYLRLRDFKGYHDTATPGPHFPSPYVPVPVREVYLSSIALQAKAGGPLQQKAVLADLHDDIQTWRRMLTGSGSLISKMVAVANLHGDHVLLADLIAERKFDAEGLSAQILAALDLLTEDDWKIGSASGYEFRAVAFVWDQQRVAMGRRTGQTPGKEGQWWERLLEFRSPFFQINAIQNLQARETVQRKLVADAPPKDFLAARDVYRKWLDDNVQFGVHYVYNPFGKFILAMEAGNNLDYSLRAYDGAALVRLVRLGYEIRSQKIEDREIRSFMQRHPEWASHPVSGKPFVWDGRTREIALQNLGNQPKDRRFSITAWSAAPRK